MAYSSNPKYSIEQFSRGCGYEKDVLKIETLKKKDLQIIWVSEQQARQGLACHRLQGMGVLP
jgi:hypothetical protein